MNTFDYPPNRYESKPDRGGCLTIWLLLSTLGAALALFAIMNLIAVLNDNPLAASRVPMYAVWLLVALVIAMCVGLYGMWNWKRWGAYLIAFTAFASPAVEAFIGIMEPSDCIAPFVQIGILAWLLNSKWDYFD